MAAHAPLGRLGDDEDLKGITLLYASDAGKHITGQWLAVDGGVSVVLGADMTDWPTTSTSAPTRASIPFVAPPRASSCTRSRAANPRSRYTREPEHLNTFDVTHGGACMTLLDVAMAAAARSEHAGDRRRHDRDEDQLHAARASARCVARGRLLHRTATMAFTEATIYDERGARSAPMPPAPSST